MKALAPKEKLASQVSLALLAGTFSIVPVAYAHPTGHQVMAGGASVTEGTHTVITSTTKNNVINWQDFSVGNDERVTFDGGAKSNNYLNNVTGAGSSYINGIIEGGNNVYLVNENGVIMGANASIDVGSLYVSTQPIDVDAMVSAANTANGGASPIDMTVSYTGVVKADVINMGQINASKVEVIGRNITFLNEADVSASEGVTLTSKGVEDPEKQYRYVHVGYESGEGADRISANYVITDGNSVDGDNAFKLVTTADEFQAINDSEAALAGNYMLAPGYNSEALRESRVVNESLTLFDGFKPIGGNEVAPFSGNFDGLYTKINGLNVNEKYAGLFGEVAGTSDKPATIMNVGVVDAKVTAKATAEDREAYGGGIVGYAKYAKISNVYNSRVSSAFNIVVQGTNDTAYSYVLAGAGVKKGFFRWYGTVGGVAGKVENGFVDGVYNTGKVFNGAGLVGELSSSTLKTSYNAGEVWNRYDYTDSAASSADDLAGDYPLMSHYMLVDKMDDASKVVNVYNKASYHIYPATYVEEKDYKHALVPTSTGVSNAYSVNIDPTIADGSRLYTSTGSAIGGLAGTGDERLGANYNFTDAYGDNISDGKNVDWRIYDGRSVPLLRNLLIGKVGTVPVNATYKFYKPTVTGTTTVVGDSATTSYTVTASTEEAGTFNHYGYEIPYTGYYVGAAEFSDEAKAANAARGVDSTNIRYSDAKVRNAGDSETFFYSDTQDGYDLASDKLTVVRRNMAPVSGTINIEKVYDGGIDAKDELSTQIGLGDELVDEAVYTASSEGGLLKGTGLVKYQVSSSSTGIEAVSVDVDTKIVRDMVSLDPSAITKAEFEHANVYAYEFNEDGTVKSRTWEQALNVILADDPALMDASPITGNYKFDSSPIKEGKVTFEGKITARPVYLQLQKKEGLDKYYDGTSTVYYTDAAWVDSGTAAKVTDNVKNISSKSSADNQGLIDELTDGEHTDGVSLEKSVSDYINDSTAEAVAHGYTNAVTDTTNYSIKYKVGLKATGDAKKAIYAADNYTLFDAADGVEDADELSADGFTATGKINRRNIAKESINYSFYDGTSDTPVTTFEKTYDYKDDYNGVNKVSLTTSSGLVEVSEAQVDGAGIMVADNTAFAKGFKLDDSLGQHFLYVERDDEGHIKSESEVLSPMAVDTAEAKAANAIKFNITMDDSGVLDDGRNAADVLKNYTMDGSPLSGLTDYRDAHINKRAITVGLAKTADIDKVYNNSNEVTDAGGVGYLQVANSAATGGSGATGTAGADKGYVGVTSSKGLVIDDSLTDDLNDGVGWNVSAVYLTTANEGSTATGVAAEDVYRVSGTPQDKDIRYTVGLTGSNAVNYTLNGVDVGTAGTDSMTVGPSAKITEKYASGTISPLTITPTINTISKVYDGTTAVFAQDLTKTPGYTAGDTYKDGTTAFTPQDTEGKSALEQIGTPGFDLDATISGYGDEVAVDFTYADAAYDTANVKVLTGKTGHDITYTGLKLKGAQAYNYELADGGSVTIHENEITPFTINTDLMGITYDTISKTYDGTTELTDAASYAKTDDFRVTGIKAGSLPTIAVTGAEYDSADRGGKDDHDVVFSYSFTTPEEESENFDYITSTDPEARRTLVEEDGKYVLKDTTTGSLLARDIVATVVKDNLTKTYDAFTTATDGAQHALAGKELITFSDKLNAAGETVDGKSIGYNATTGELTMGAGAYTNASTAEYFNGGEASAHADTYSGDGKQVHYAPTLGGTDVDLSNFNIYYKTGEDYKVYSTGATDGTATAVKKDGALLAGNGTINKRDLTLTVGDLTKEFDNSSDLTDPNRTTVGTDGFVTLDDGLLGKVIEKDSTAFDGSKLVGNGYVNAVAGDFTKNVADAQYVQYTGINEALGDVARGNYNFLWKTSDGSSAAAVTDNMAYGKGSITSLALTNTDIATLFNNVTKIYDADRNVAYNHTAGDYSTADSKTSYDFVNKLTIHGIEIDADAGKETSGGYQITSAAYNNENVEADGVKEATFTFTLGSDLTSNWDFSGLDSSIWNNTTKVLTQKVKDGSTIAASSGTTAGTANVEITPKTAYARLADSYVAPTKVYNGDTKVGENSQEAPEISSPYGKDELLSDYVTVTGTIGGDTGAIVNAEAAYKSKNVKDVYAVPGETSASNAIDYTTTMSNNYRLVTTDKSGNVINEAGIVQYYKLDDGRYYTDAEGTGTGLTGDELAGLAGASNVGALTGAGEITQKELTFQATLAEKSYDGKTEVYKDAADGTAIAYPDFSFEGEVAGEVINPDVAKITGTYMKELTTPGAYVADSHVNFDSGAVKDKAVQYTGIDSALANSGAVTGTTGDYNNYKLSGVSIDGAAVGADMAVYTPDADTADTEDKSTVLFKVDSHMGRIDRLSLTPDDLEYTWVNGISKEADLTSATKGGRLADGSVTTDSQKFFTIRIKDKRGDTDLLPELTGEARNLSYVLTDNYYTTDAEGTSETSAVTPKDSAGYNVHYNISGLSTDSTGDFAGLDGVTPGEFNSANASDTRTTNTEAVYGKITPRIINATAADGNVKIYDGDAKAENASSKITYDAEDIAFIAADRHMSEAEVRTMLNEGIDVTGTYQDLIDPSTASVTLSAEDANVASGVTGTNGKTISYNMAYNSAADEWKDNYILQTVGDADYDVAGTALTGKGDIQRRKVYVGFTDGSTTDGGKLVLADKVYDGTKNVKDDTYKTAVAVKTVDEKTGLVGTDGVTFDGSAIVAEYASKDVARNADHEVVKQDVMLNVAATLKDGDGTDDTKNYELSSETLTGTSAITPQKISLKVDKSPTKDYDGNADVKGDDYTTIANIVKAADTTIAESDADKAAITAEYATVGKALLKVAVTGGTDTVTVTLDKAPQYNDKNVYNADKTRKKDATYTLTWDNGNYDLIGEAVVDGDTFNEDLKKYNVEGTTVSRTGELVDHQAVINPLKLTVGTVHDIYKTYDGTDSMDSKTALAKIAEHVDGKEDTVTGLLDGERVTDIMTAKGRYLSADGETFALNPAAANAATGETATELIKHKMAYELTLKDDVNTGLNYQFTDDGASVYKINGGMDEGAGGTDAEGGIGIIKRAPLYVRGDTKTVYGSFTPDGTVTGWVNGETEMSVGTGGAFSYHSADGNTSSLGGHTIYGWYKNSDAVGGNLMKYGTYSYTDDDAGESKENVTGWYPEYSGELHYSSVDGWYSVEGTGTTYFHTMGASKPNYGANYYLEQKPGTVTVKATPTPTPTPKPQPEPTVVVPEEGSPAANLITPTRNAYTDASHDNSDALGRVPRTSIEYVSRDGSTTTVESSAAGTTPQNSAEHMMADVQEPVGKDAAAAIESADVVNLSGRDVVSTGSQEGRAGISSTETRRMVTIDTTELGYLSVSASNDDTGMPAEGTPSFEADSFMTGALDKLGAPDDGEKKQDDDDRRLKETKAEREGEAAIEYRDAVA